jgi:hypothetical protein
MLSNEEIDQLNQFCEKHRVGYYDVRLELVDHLASSIESMREKAPRLSFDQALEKIYKQFGYRGFAGVVEAKEEEMSKAYVRQARGLFLSYFTLPKVAFTVMLASGLFSLQFFLGNRELRWAMATAIIPLMILDIRSFVLSRRTGLLRDRPLLMLKKRTGISISGTALVANLLNFFNMTYADKVHLAHTRVYTIFVVVFTLSVLVSLCASQMGKRIRHNARMQYPEAFLAQS